MALHIKAIQAVKLPLFSFEDLDRRFECDHDSLSPVERWILGRREYYEHLQGEAILDRIRVLRRRSQRERS